MKIKLEIVIDVDEKLYPPVDKDRDSWEWFWNTVLVPETLILHSNEVGDTVAQVQAIIKKEFHTCELGKAMEHLHNPENQYTDPEELDEHWGEKWNREDSHDYLQGLI